MKKKLLAWLACAMILSANLANALVIDGGGTLNINSKITGNNEDIVLYNGTLNLNPGGTIGNSLYLMYGDSTANFVGGMIDNYVYLNNGTLNIMSGGIHGDVASGISTWANGQPMGLGQVNIYGGDFTNPYGVARYLNAVGNGRFDVYGGNFTNNDLLAQQNGVIYIYGSNFNFDYGVIAASEGNLTGTLSTGEAFNMNFKTYGNGSIHLVSVPEPVTSVPEPATILLLGMGLIAGLAGNRLRRGR